jgi:hypothetical protein
MTADHHDWELRERYFNEALGPSRPVRSAGI